MKMAFNKRKLESSKLISIPFFNNPLNSIQVNKIRTKLLLIIDSEIPNIQKKGNDIKLHFYETITTPIEVKYYSFSSLKNENSCKPLKKINTEMDFNLKEINLQKMTLSKKTVKNFEIPSDQGLKYNEKISTSKKQSLIKGLIFLHNMAINYRKVNSNLKINGKTISL